MAQGIQDIGNGLGLIYVIATDGTTILATQPNTIDGVRQVRSLGASSAPISAQRPAIGTVRITSVVGASNLVGVVINAVNQIAAPVAATVGNTFQTAFDIADAINSFAPLSGPNYTAQASGDTIFIFSPPADGVAVNNSVITVSASNGNITRVVTPLTNGANGSGAFDSVVGLRFGLNANYTNPVLSTTLVGSIDITSHIVVRGMQSGTPLVTGAITSDAISVVNRYSTIQELQVFTQGSTPTDYLGYINPFEFSPGDTIRLRSGDLAQVTTVVDVSDLTPLSTFQRNIYLCNQASFELASNRCIILTLVYDSTAGLIWVEDTRAFSSSSSIITTTRAGLLATLSGGLSTAGQQYLVTDIFGCTGVVCEAISPSEIKLSCDIIAQVPDYQDTSGNFGGVWYPQLAAATINKWYVYDGVMYVNTTGAVSVGVIPPLNAVNWSLIPLSSGFYITEIHYGEVNLVNDCITLRRDKRNNVTKTAYPALGFQIQHFMMAWGNDKVYNNELSFTTNFRLNTFAGDLCYGNKITDNAQCFYSGDNYFHGTPLGWFYNNEIKQATITEVYAGIITNNNFGYLSTVTDIGDFANSGNFALDDCTFNQSNFYVNSGAFFLINVGSLTMNNGSTIQLNAVGAAQIVISGLVLASGSSFNLNVDGVNNITSTTIDAPGGQIGNINLINGSSLNYCTVTQPEYMNLSLDGSTLNSFNINRPFFNTTALIGKVYNNDIYDTLNLDDPLVYNAGTQTLFFPSSNRGLGGTYLLTSSNPTETISKILVLGYGLGLPSFRDNPIIFRFYAEDGLIVTFNNEPVATAAGGDIIGDTAIDVIVGRGVSPTLDGGLSDYIEYIGMQANANDMVRKLFINIVS